MTTTTPAARLLRTLCCAALCALPASAMQLLDGIVAVVGDEPILYSELEAYTLMRVNEQKLKPDSAAAMQLRQTFLDELVEGKVLLAHAREDSTIRVSPTEVEAGVTEHINQILGANSITMEQLEVELGRQGQTLPKFRSLLRRGIEEQLLRRNVQQRYVAAVEVTRHDVEQFFAQYRDSLPPLGESVRLRTLVINVAPPDSVRQAVFEKIKKIKQRLDNGEPFDQLARLFSQDPNAAAGGDLGFVGKGTLAELAFEEKVFALQPGEVSEPFQTRLGFHIATVTAKKDQRVHVKQIFLAVAPPEELKAAALARLDSIRAVCHDTACFGLAVRAFSSDAPSRSRGGDLGWSLRGLLPASCATALDTLAPGTLSKPVADENTFTLYLVADHVASRPASLESDWDAISEKAKDILAQKKLAELVKRWRQEILVDIRL